MIKIINTSNPLADAAVLDLLALLRSGSLVSLGNRGSLDVPAIVADIIVQVRATGDKAVVELTNKLDRANLNAADLRVPESELEAAWKNADPQLMAILKKSAANIRFYQEKILHTDVPVFDRGGRKLSLRYTPIDRVAVYVPGGKALYPSTVLMTVIPALVAGVKEIVMASPPTGGDIDPLVKAMAYELGIKEVYRVGGAVAIAALAFGTQSLKAVSKIVGPGNAFVAEAKRRVFGRVGIDSVAGPSEVCILADSCADPELMACDLIAQAEHDPGSGILVTDDKTLANNVNEALEKIVPLQKRSAEIKNALEKYSAVFTVPSMESAVELVNEIASEHLELIVSDVQKILPKIRNAGAIFVGKNTPVPIGDYWAGPSHVLPTGGGAKFFGPLSCNDFLKSTSVIEYDEKSIKEDASDAAAFAEYEGLFSHAYALRKRL